MSMHSARVTVVMLVLVTRLNTTKLIGQQLLIIGSAADDRIMVVHMSDGRLRADCKLIVGRFRSLVDALGGDDYIFVAMSNQGSYRVGIAGVAALADDIALLPKSGGSLN